MQVQLIISNILAMRSVPPFRLSRKDDDFLIKKSLHAICIKKKFVEFLAFKRTFFIRKLETNILGPA